MASNNGFQGASGGGSRNITGAPPRGELCVLRGHLKLAPGIQGIVDLKLVG